jgi:hypothetical protein
MNHTLTQWTKALVCIAPLVLGACGCGGDGVPLPESETAPKETLTMDQALVLVGRVGALWGVADTTVNVAKRLLDNHNVFGSDQSTGSCWLGGTVRDTYKDVDGNKRVSAGDLLESEAFQCRERATGGAEISSNGKVSLLVRQAEGSQDKYFESFLPWHFSTRQTYTALVSTTPDSVSRLEGAIETEHSHLGAVLRFDQFVRSTQTSQNVVVRVLKGEFRQEYASHVGNPAYKGVTYTGLDMRTNLTAEREVALTSWGSMTLSGVGNVLSGQLRVSTGKDSIVVQVLGPDQVRVDLDVDANGTVDASRAGVWSTLVNTSIF